MNNKITYLFLLVMLIPVRLLSAAPLAIGERINIDSATLNETREFEILLPENYHSDNNTTYPVIYLLDGDYNFHTASGMLDLLANKAQLIPDVILVGIADKGTDEYRQYMTPKQSSSSQKKQRQGKAEQFLTFLGSELSPYIKRNYRASEHSILVGHSIGGLFVLNALITSPHSYRNYIATSPALWLNDHAFVKDAAAKIASSEHDPVGLYLALGDETRMGQYRFIDLLDEQLPNDIDWHFKHYPDENHNSVGMIALRDSLKTIFKGWFIAERELNKTDSADDLVAYYKALQTSLDLSQPIPTPSIKAAIRYFYRENKQTEIAKFMEKVDKELPASAAEFTMMSASYGGYYDSPQQALTILLEAEERFKNSIEYIKSIAVAYEKLDNKQQAFAYYQKAQKLAQSQHANQWQLNIIEAKLKQNQR